MIGENRNAIRLLVGITGEETTRKTKVYVGVGTL
jgi:hypothetical protein